MKYHLIRKLPIFLITIIFIISFILISTHERGIQISSYSVLAKGEKTSPPRHAKAHGYEAKHTYRYYSCGNPRHLKNSINNQPEAQNLFP
jgi:hypothetical protein